MSDYQPILNALSEDLAAICLGYLVFGTLYIIPSMVVAFFAAARVEQALWSELTRGSFWGWLIGVTAWVSSSGLLILLAEMLFGRWITAFRIELFCGFAFIGFLVAIGMQYHLVTHYYHGRIQLDDASRLVEPRFKPVKQHFKFSLKNLLIAQVALIFLFGVWVGAPGDAILQNYEQRRVKEIQEQKTGMVLPASAFPER